MERTWEYSDSDSDTFDLDSSDEDIKPVEEHFVPVVEEDKPEKTRPRKAPKPKKQTKKPPKQREGRLVADLRRYMNRFPPTFAPEPKKATKRVHFKEEPLVSGMKDHEVMQMWRKNYPGYLESINDKNKKHYERVQRRFPNVPFDPTNSSRIKFNERETPSKDFPLTFEQQEQLKVFSEKDREKWKRYFSLYNWVETQRMNQNTLSPRFRAPQSPYPWMPPHRDKQLSDYIEDMEMKRIYENEFIIQ